ncbi:hypothetical protein MesoLj113a_43810 [Mesorhizobium sp. 113-1-2]|nr:hypothetical protein MesoLj113a_43810 [Mesorhizobium sp. 113-1-2]
MIHEPIGAARRVFLSIAAMVAAFANRIALADTSSSLPDAAKNGGMSLLEALSLRQSTRLFADKPIDDETLSTLLWCAFGIKRQELRVPLQAGGHPWSMRWMNPFWQRQGQSAGAAEMPSMRRQMKFMAGEPMKPATKRLAGRS